MPLRRITKFLELDAAAGIILALAAVAAIISANAPWSGVYNHWLATNHTLTISGWSHTTSFQHWVKDGLMAIFFFHVGLDIKREIMVGELSDPKKLALPVIAALGGMIAPAIVYLTIWQFSGADPALRSGWAIPVATDIAFAVAAISLVLHRVPMALKVFLLTLAVVDDLGAVVLVAGLYTTDINYQALAMALGALILLFGAAWIGLRRPWVFVAAAIFIWALMLSSGFHPTIGAILAASAVPLKAQNPKNEGPLDDLHDDLDPWVKYAIMPLFAFTHAGFSFAGLGTAQIFAPLTLGIAAGLVIGKPIGVALAAFIAVKLGAAKLPQGASWAQMLGVGALCGIGFTMSLFLGGLAFDGTNGVLSGDVRIGVFVGSILSAIIGIITLSRTEEQAKEPAKGITAD